MKKTLTVILCIALTITLFSGTFSANASQAEFLRLLPYYKNYVHRVLLPENQQNPEFRNYCDNLLPEAERMAKGGNYTERQYADMTNRLEASWMIWRAEMPISLGILTRKEQLLNTVGDLGQYDADRVNHYNSVIKELISTFDTLKDNLNASDLEGESAIELLSNAIKYLKGEIDFYPDVNMIKAKHNTLERISAYRFQSMRSTINRSGKVTQDFLKIFSDGNMTVRNLHSTASDEYAIVTEMERYFIEVFEPGIFIGNYFITRAREEYFKVAEHYQDYTPYSWKQVSDAMEKCDDVKNSFGNDVESNKAFNALCTAINQLELYNKPVYDIVATADKEKVSEGEEITLTVKAPAGSDVRHALISIDYDPALFEFTRSKDNVKISDGKISTTFISSTENAEEINLLTCTFKVKDGAYKITAPFKLTAEKLYDKRGSDIEIEIKDASVEIDTDNVRFDLNKDSSVNTSDVREALKYAVEDREYTLSADYDKDGRITTTDARKMLKSLVDAKAPDLKITLIDGAKSRTTVSGAEYSNIKLPLPAERKGYIFKGWNTSPDGTGVFADENYKIQSSKNLYAVWEKFDTGSVDNEKFMFGAFCAIATRYAVEDDFKMLAKSGTKFILMDYTHNDRKSEQCVKWAEKYGITLIITDSMLNHSDFSRTAILNATEPYRDSPAFGGNNLIDEPGISTIKTLQAPQEKYRQVLPQYSLHINLFPIEAEIMGLNFTNYLKEYQRCLSNSLHLSSDPYCLRTINGIKHTEERHLTSLGMTGRLAKELNQEHWVYIQTMTGMETKERTMTEYADYTFQTYTAMAYGAKKIVFYCYDIPHYRPGAPFNAQVQAFRDSAHGYTYIWDYGKALTDEIHTFSDVFETYSYVDTYVHRGSNIPDYINAEKEYSGSALTDIQSNESLIIGEFQKDGKKAVMITNASELQDQTTANVTFTLKEAKDITLWVDGVQKTISPVNGTYSISIKTGGGAFILCD